MRTLLKVLCLLMLMVVPAGALELGAGLTYFSQSAEAAPFLGIGTTMAGQDAFLTWARENDTNHTIAQFTLPFYEIEYLATMYVLGGAGIAWSNWDTWQPELVYGLGMKGDVAHFTGRAGWMRLERGGGWSADNTYFVGVYLGTAATSGKK